MATYTNPTVDRLPHFKWIQYLDTGVAIFTCHGSPEGVIIANTGSIALSDNGSVYKKTSDDVATGWVDLAAGGGGGANQALSNLVAVAVNASLISDTDNTDDLGSNALRWKNLFLAGFLQLSGVNVGLFHTPVGNDVPTKIAIPVFNPGGFGQIIAFGLDSAADGTARVLSLFDQRTPGHQLTLAIFSPNENQLLGFSWDGSNVLGQVGCSQILFLNGTRVFIRAPNSAPTDGDIPNGVITMRLDEGANQLSIRVRYSDGTLKTGTVNLV